MKIPALLVLSFACALAAGAQTAEPTPPANKKVLPRIVLPPDKPGTTAPAPVTATSVPPAKATTAVAQPTPVPKTPIKVSAKKEAAMGKIEGIEISRGAKGFMGIQIVGTVFKLTFYDDKKKPIAADVDRAALRWDPKNKIGEERVVLNSDGGTSLTAPKNIRPPYNFKLFITLIKDAADGQQPVNESYSVDFRQ
ncbi:MAG: hypothetical protein V4773_26590 [Verrucomicrobiota bacterium]